MSEKAPHDPQLPKHPNHRNALIEIRKILSDPNLTDSACIEAICRVLEKLPDMPSAEFRSPQK